MICIADPNHYTRRLVQGMLRNFGANKIIEATSSEDTLKILSEHKIDVMICDSELPPKGGLSLARTIRHNKDVGVHTLPILLMTADAREATIKMARDAGTNMVLLKPISPKNLYDRLAWVAFTPRNFVDSPAYFGPDRRLKIEGYPNGVGRRKGDQPVEVGKQAGPPPVQNNSDKLLASG